ncbi:MAG TPA: TonB-dependent receptor [Roseateles sp.]|uniref:TonB-dependent receptor n=1 Tax=Roseateles sp. TaxID=1971397 RepID=UPI002ED91B06
MTMSNDGRGKPAAMSFRISPVAIGCTLLIASTGALAQQAAAAQTLDTVVVTGIRKGIEDAIVTKKNSNSIIESISAEDIGKLPDTSIAESIARLPGIAAQRTRGRASQISIRGMAPDYAATLLNGREQVTTGDSRGVEFDQFPGELISKVDIYKSPDAALVGHGLSGTFNMQTARPLAFKDRAVALNYRKQKLGVGTVSEGDGFRASVSYIDNFADRTIGVALGFARLDETTGQTERFDSWGGGTAPFNGQTVNVPYNGFGLFADQTKQTRDGAMAVLQFKPNANFESTVDVYYSKFDQVKSTKGFQAPLNDSWLDAGGNGYDKPGQLINATLSGSNVTQGTFNNVRAVIRNDAEDLKDRLSSVGWNNKFKFDGDWMLEADLNRSTAKRRGQIIETTAGLAQSAPNTAQMDTLQFTDGRSFKPGFNYADRNIVKLTDVQGWGGGVNSPQAGYSKLPNVNDELNSGKLVLHKALKDNAWFSGYQLGANYTEREKTRAYVEGRLVIAGAGPLGAADMPGSGTLTLSGITFATFDPTNAIGSVYQIAPKLHPDIYNKDWKVQEKLSTAFARADIDTELLGMPVRGNVGLQVVGTKQNSTGFNVDRGNCPSDQNCPALESKGGANYTDILPSLNLNFELSSDQIVRLGVSRVMARANLNEMRASLGLSVSTFNENGQQREIYTGDAGNPSLKPTRANAFDVAYEKYFGTKAYVGVAGFYKDLRTYVLRQSVPFDFTPYITPSTKKLPSNIGALTMPLNGNGGTLKGLELSASMPFSMLWSALDGFGVQANYSYTNSSVKLLIGGVTVDGISSVDIPLPGLSKNVSNLTLYYEKYGFSARVAARKRSDFIGEVSSFTGDRQFTWVKGDTVTDLQLGYEVQRGMFKGLSLVFQVNNVTDEPFIRYANNPSDIRENTKYGKTYLFGLNYKL